MFNPTRVNWMINHYLTIREEEALIVAAQAAGISVSVSQGEQSKKTEFPYIGFQQGYLSRVKGKTDDSFYYTYRVDFEQVMKALQKCIKDGSDE